MRLGPSNPIRLLFGPIFQMEVRTAGRRTSTYVFRALVGGTVLTFFAIMLLSLWNEVAYERSAFRRIQVGQNIAPTLVVFITWTQYVSLILLAPLITGPALCDERRNRTMAALLTTPLTAWEIVLGKLTGRLTQAIILALVAVPMVFAARMLGGVSLEGIIATVTLTIVSVFMCSALALLLSASSTRATAAATAGLVVFLFFNFGPLAIGWMYMLWIQRHFPSLPEIPFEWAIYTSLPVALGAVVFEHFVGEPSGFSSWQLWGFASVYGLVVTIGAVALAGFQLRRSMRTDPESLMARVETKRKKRRKRRRGTPALADAEHDPAEEVESESRVVGDLPVLWREMGIGAFRRKRRLIEAVVVLLAIFGLMYANKGMQQQAAHALVTIIGIGLLMLQAVFATTGSIAHERQSQTLDVLMTTPLRPRAIILGKVAGAMRRLWFIPLAVGIHFALAVAVGEFSILVLPLLALSVLPSVIMFVGTGILMSVLFRKAISAAVANLFLALFFYAGIPIVLVIVENTFNMWSDDWFETVLNTVFMGNPFFTGMSSVSGTGAPFNWNGNATPSFEFETIRSSVEVVDFVVAISISALVEVSVAVGAIALASRLLPERFGRPS